MERFKRGGPFNEMDKRTIYGGRAPRVIAITPCFRVMHKSQSTSNVTYYERSKDSFMPMPTDVPVIDLMLAVPNDDTSNFYDFIRPLLMDERSRQMFKMPAQYMFKDLPVGKRDDYIAYTLEKMDEFNIEKAMLGVDEGQYETQCEAEEKSIRTGSSRPMTAILITGWMRFVRFARLKEYDIKSVNAFPSGLCLRCRCPTRSGTRFSLPASTWIFHSVPAWVCPTPNSHGARKSSTSMKFAGSSGVEGCDEAWC